MDKKEFLKQYVNATRKIHALLDDISQLNDLSDKISKVLLTAQPSSQEKAFAVLLPIADMEKDLEAELKSLKDIKSTVQTAIERVEDDRQKDVLYRRYILGDTWESIADDMGLSYQWVCGLHTRALKNIPPVDSNLYQRHDKF